MEDDDIVWLKRTAADLDWTRRKSGAVGFPFEWVVGDVLRGVESTLEDIAANAQRKKDREKQQNGADRK